METPVLALVIGALVVGAAFLVYHLWYLWKRRRALWEPAAVELGLVFVPDLDLAERYRHLKFFSRGHGRRTRLALRGETAGGELLLADYQYTTGGGKSQATHLQTVCLLTGADLSLPHFTLRRELAVLDRIGELFGAQDIDFAEDPEFSGAFVLKGDDEARVRDLFHIERRQRMLQLLAGRVHLEGEGDVLLFHTGRLVDPTRARDLVVRAGELLDAFRR